MTGDKLKADRETHTFTTGAKRSSTLPRYDLIPHVPWKRVAQRLTGKTNDAGVPDGGALKYGECNWECGMPTSDTLNHVLDHIQIWADTFRVALRKHNGDMEKVRADMIAHSSVDDDLAGAVFGLIVLMHQEDTGMFHDDRFKVVSETKS